MEQAVREHRADNSELGIISREVPLKTGTPLGANFGKVFKSNGSELKPRAVVSNSDVLHYVILIILGLLSWVLAWCACGDDGWRWDGQWSRVAAVVAVAWTGGQLLQGITTLPPLLPALIIGILARHFDILDIRDYPEVDSFFRKIFPVVILGKGSLSWNLSFMRSQWRMVATVGVLPWTLEVFTMACCTNVLLGFPWIWGVMLGSFYASVSCPVLMARISHLQVELGCSRNWPQTVCTAGGVDTALSVGVYGILCTFTLVKASITYRMIKVCLGLVVGVCAGVGWGSLARFVPHVQDAHVTPLRVLFVLLFGLSCSFFTATVGWGGTAGVAVLACNATAAHYWARAGWPLGRNPAVTTYHVLWAACEPVLFAFTGSYIVLSKETLYTLPIAIGILVICLCVRMLATMLVSSCAGFSIREKLFLMSAWSTKSIVEAVLCPVALNMLILNGADPDDPRLEYAENMVRITVVAILVTTPLGFLLTSLAGPRLLRHKDQNGPNNNEA